MPGELVGLSSTFSELPFFIQYGRPEAAIFVGLCQNRSVRTTFESFQLQNFLVKHAYFNGLLDMFVDKIVGALVFLTLAELSVGTTCEHERVRHVRLRA